MVIFRFVVRQYFRMEYMDKIRQNNFRFYRHALIERHIFHITIYDTMIFPRIEISITVVLFFQYVVTVVAVKTIYNPPVISMRGICIDCLIGEMLAINFRWYSSDCFNSSIIRVMAAAKS